MRTLDAKGGRLPSSDPLERLEDDLSDRIVESMFGGGPEERVHQLRASVLGKSVRPPLTFSGLAAFVPPVKGES